jgi:hypothetical protein
MSSAGTSEKTYLGLQGRRLGLLISVIATTGFLLFGYDQGVMSGIIGAEQFNAYFPETLDNSVYQGFVTAIYEIGCLFGAIFSLVYGDRFGRRRMASGIFCYERFANMVADDERGRYHDSWCNYTDQLRKRKQSNGPIHYWANDHWNWKWNSMWNFPRFRI